MDTSEHSLTGLLENGKLEKTKIHKKIQGKPKLVRDIKWARIGRETSG